MPELLRRSHGQVVRRTGELLQRPLRAHPLRGHLRGVDRGHVRDLPSFTGGKILAYPHVPMELTCIDEFSDRAAADPRFARLAAICERHEGIWNEEAERYLLEAFRRE